MLTKYVAKLLAKWVQAMQSKRSARIIMTNEARVLKEMRLAKGLSMRKAGLLIGLSDSYVAHVETGRIDPPSGEKLEKFLGVYGGIKEKSFYERVRTFQERVTPKDKLMELIDRANGDQIKMLLNIANGLFTANS